MKTAHLFFALLLTSLPFHLWADEPAPLDASFSLGATMNKGNSENEKIHLGLDAKKEWDATEFILKAEFNYGKENSQKNVENGEAVTQYNWFLDEAQRFYVNSRSRLFYDPITDVDYRFNLGIPGLGYYFVKNDRMELAGDTAVEYMWEKVSGVKDNKAILRLSQRLTLNLSETAKIFQSIDYSPELEDFSSYLIQAEVGIESMINSHMSLRLSAQERYDSTPAEGKENDDLTMIAALVYTL